MGDGFRLGKSARGREIHCYIMEERYHVPTYTEHDPNCIMLAERAVGCLKNREVREAVLMTFDPRVGAGMSTMTRGQLIHGVRGRAEFII